jgi:hypothetical protein
VILGVSFLGLGALNAYRSEATTPIVIAGAVLAILGLFLFADRFARDLI